ncbi:uncharacterized protein LOC110028594 [Phalaenopsis equestris]|uniref:uncharacterized protein LOC110028594 n=1 Tax=Phalaenopsis equestris TaxID=78828 RepID=UPI0009E6036D|nr:uncharacterized protein LOC110028594 [Phalaenopsis equestris]XP_020586161.1 uncharacterized protein LOC110028594 [Phalaenopsis equestris]XP_020586162.1 uncharacterized protein LOC110028594 [Phalaenopsis equestris]
MECNRDEALRAKEHAERKFTEKDYVGAKKLALKAQNLSPTLDGISQMLTVFDIYIASEAKINGERDWYGVLHINTSADEETVKKQYRKLVLLLHPDKNKSAGAEGAFQFVSEAWNVLSNKSKKMVYDQKIFVKISHQKTFQTSNNDNNTSTPSTKSNGFNQNTNMTTVKSRTQQNNSCRPPSVPPSPSQPPFQTFWTSCTGCCMQYEYHRMYLNKSLLCPKCKKPFLAKELPLPPSGHNHPPWYSKQQHHKKAYEKFSAHPGMGASGFQHGLSRDSSNNTSFQNPPFSGAAATHNANGSSACVQQAATAGRQSHENAKRYQAEERAAARREKFLRRRLSTRNHGGSETLYAGFGADISLTRSGNGAELGKNDSGEQMDSNSRHGGNIVPGAVMGTWHYVNFLKSRLSSSPTIFNREIAQINAKAILMEKAKVAILEKLEEFNLAIADMAAKKQKTKDVNEARVVDKVNAKYTVHRSDVKVLDGPRSKNEEFSDKEVLQKEDSSDPNEVVNQSLSIDVPDSDFYDFDKDRTEKTFGDDQVWATYDDDDGMPRYYAYIQKVISAKPFKVRMSFLTSKSNVEFGSLKWVSSGFCKTCGDFRVGRYSVINTINIFSHKIKWEKGFRGVFKVLPRKGDIWALYRNWCPDWNERTPDDVIHKYEMVEVLEDYCEDQGILVVPLAKVTGFRTLFFRHMDPKENLKIPKEEMFRFSHQVPFYLLTGEEDHNAPKDCLELDPAATPLELLQVLANTTVGS